MTGTSTVIPWTGSSKPTLYAGVAFKSRLESKWAFFFDHHDLDWVYEPYQLVLSDGTIYLPDFYLPQLRSWFEVKGQPTPENLAKPVALWQTVAAVGQRVVVGVSEGEVAVLHRHDDGASSTAGAIVRCSACQSVWFANPYDRDAGRCPHCDDPSGGRLHLAAAQAALEARLRLSWLGNFNKFAYIDAVSDA